ncbi:MAG: tetraacyldisaccharide 4'-kinase [Acidobacteriota bacterium]
MTLEPPAPPRSPWQLFYGAVHTARRRWYRKRARHLPRPVISIGNLHFGGTGKTPMTIAVAGHLRDRGRRVAILSRGYRRARGADVRIVSAGDGPLLGPRSAGDEPVLMAGELHGVAVLVGRDRTSAGLHAMTRLPQPPDIFVLDDGFSHLALARDLDLLLFPISDPFAGGRLAPSGRLREPLAAASRADAVVLTGVTEGDTASGAGLAAGLRSRGFAGPGFSSRTIAGEPRDERGEPLCPGTRVVLAAGIARPEGFFASARAWGLEVVATIAFPDHHDFPRSSLARLERAARDGNAEAILLTAKDLVKLRGRSAVRLAELPVCAEPERDFWTWLDGQVQGFAQ